MAGLGFAQFVLLYVTLALILPFTFIAMMALFHILGFLLMLAVVFTVFMVADTIDRRRRR